jgi:hypothetical protein
MAQKKPSQVAKASPTAQRKNHGLTFQEIKELTQEMAMYLSICAKQPVEIRLQGHAGLAYTHSIEDDLKKHVIPMVLNPAAIEKIRNRERAINVWWGLGAHELAHHLWPAAKYYEKAYGEGFGRLFNLIDDEQNERRGRSEHPEWGAWFQSLGPLCFPKKAVFEGNTALTGGFGEENSWIKPGGFIADQVYIKRYNQFGYFLRRHNTEPKLVKDKAVAAAMALIPARLKDLTKEELFELTRQVHETLCRGINKPEERVQFRNKPKDPTKKEGEGEGEEAKDDSENKDDKDKEGKDAKEQPKKPEDDESLKEDDENKEGEENKEDAEKKKKEDEEKAKKDAEKAKKEAEKKKKEEKEKKEKKSWDPRKLLTSKWLLIPLALFIAGWTYLFSMAGTNFWLQLFFFCFFAFCFIAGFVFLRWGAIKAFLLWMKPGGKDTIRRFFMRKSVRRYLLPPLGVLALWLVYKCTLWIGLPTTFFVLGALLFYILMKRLNKLSISGASGGLPPGRGTIWSLRLTLWLATLTILAAIGYVYFMATIGILMMIVLGMVALFTLLINVAMGGGINAVRDGKFGSGTGMRTPGFKEMLKALLVRIQQTTMAVLMIPLQLFKFLGIHSWGVIAWLFSHLWEGVKAVARVLGVILAAIWRVVAFTLSVTWRYTWWAVSISFRWTLTQILRAWWFCSPWLKRMWKYTWFRLLVIAIPVAAVIMMGYALLVWANHINFWFMIALIVLALLLLLLAFLFRKKLAKFIVNELFQPMPALMRQFIAPPLDMTTDWFLPVNNIEPAFADQAWMNAHMPEITALAAQLRPIFASCGFSDVDKEDQPEGFDLIDEIELALLGESSIFIGDETIPKASLHIEFALDCSGSMGFSSRALGPAGKFELGKLMALAVEHAVIGLPGVSAHFWGFRGNVIYDCGIPGQRRVSGLSYGGGNNDSAMLWHMGQNAARSGKKMQLLLMASDGMPAECSWLSLRNLVSRFEQEGMIPWNFGLDVIEQRAFRNFTDMVGQDKPQAIQTFGRALATLASDS